MKRMEKRVRVSIRVCFMMGDILCLVGSTIYYSPELNFSFFTVFISLTTRMILNTLNILKNPNPDIPVLDRDSLRYSGMTVSISTQVSSLRKKLLFGLG